MIEKHRRRKAKRRPPHYPGGDPDRFHRERKTAGMTQLQAAEYLGVSVRTVKNWESGTNRIPYPAFKLVRMRARAIVHVEGWEGWRFARDGALVTPTGRTFHPWELEQLELVLSLARRYVEDRTHARKVVPLRAVA
jgi:DNA-binding transcriptional regulator YiaG